MGTIDIVFNPPSEEEEVLMTVFSLKDAEIYVAGLKEKYPDRYQDEYIFYRFW